MGEGSACSAYLQSQIELPKPWWLCIWGKGRNHGSTPTPKDIRPKKAALDAIEVCRQRCWKKDWVIDLDVQKFFDTVPWDLIVKAVEAVNDTAWVLLYVKRWLVSPVAVPRRHSR